MSVKILIIDDDEDIRDFLADHCASSIGADVETCDNPSKAMDYCKKDKYHLMILDYRMPEISGYELAKQIRGEENPNQQTAILFCSGFTTGLADQLMQQQIANSAVIKKPVDLDELDEYLQMAQSSAA